MGRSKLEEALAQHLALLARAEPPWPYPQPARELHPDWCCEHPKVKHYRERSGVEFCQPCDRAGDGPHSYRHGRNWRVDFAYRAQRIAIECEGVRYDTAGRHQTGAGYEADLAKYAWMQLQGWTVIRVGQREITSGVALALIEQALRAAKAVA